MNSKQSTESKTSGEELTKKQKIIKEIKSIALIVVLVFAFRSVFFEPFRIPSGSMIPTLMIGDFILVNKFAYGFKVPFSDMFSDPIYLTESEAPKRGDVVVFKYPKDPSVNYIKRVIAVPGDRVEMVDKKVYINGNQVDIQEISGKEIMEDMDDNFKNIPFTFYKSKKENTTHLIQVADRNSSISNFVGRVVPKGHYFVMGDNRDFSLDSRYWGFVPHEYIKGKAVMVWFSMIFPFGDNAFKFRPYRIGTMIN